MLCDVLGFLRYTPPLGFYIMRCSLVSMLCNAYWSLFYTTAPRVFTLCAAFGFYAMHRPPLCSNALFYVGIGKVAVLAFCLVAVGFL